MEIVDSSAVFKAKGEGRRATGDGRRAKVRFGLCGIVAPDPLLGIFVQVYLKAWGEVAKNFLSAGLLGGSQTFLARRIRVIDRERRALTDANESVAEV